MESLEIDDDLEKEFEFDTEWELNLLNNTDPPNYKVQNGSKPNQESLPKQEHLETLLKSFGHKTFRPMQWQIIDSIINERRDNCAVMTTGYGKSLCYQFPPVHMGGVALVISPLISLMEDQVLAMQVSNIPACLLGTANKTQKQTIDDILDEKYSLVYLTPEFCTGDCGKELLQKIQARLSVTLIAVDEAHCVSSWGHDFRFQYRHLGILKDIMPDVPILAVTATATQKVRDDIIKTLKLRNPQITCSGFDRPNLYFCVHLKSPNILGDLRKLMERKNGEWQFAGSTIIYCITRKQTEDISLLLSETGIKSLPYHAGLSLTIRKDTHEKFVRDKIDVIVATIAFGMGIDKPDVRNIIHYGASNSIEGYYQEVGRAGRDGLPATCTAFYSNRDFDTLRFLNEKNAGSSGRANKEKMIDNMRDYLSTTQCRRRYILTYFQDQKVASIARCCDNCSNKQPDGSTYEGLDERGCYDFTEDATMFLNAVNALKGKFGMNMYVLFLRGSKMNKLSNYVKHPAHGSGKNKSEAWWKGIAVLLENVKFLRKVVSAYTNFAFNAATVCVSELGEKFLKDSRRKLVVPPVPELIQCLKTKANVWLSKSSQPQPCTSAAAPASIGQDAIMKLYQLLMNKRYELATTHDCMPYAIASNAALMEMAKKKPITLEQLRKHQFEGFTEAKIGKFGKEFVKTVRSHLNLSVDCNEKLSIEDVLCQHPMDATKQNTSAHTTYSLFKSGLTVHEISQKRGSAESTVTSHLIDMMKLGYPIKLAELGVTNEIKNVVVEAVGKVDTGLALLTPIKNICPPDVTYNQIKAVVTFLKIRQHLKSLNVPYVEFEDVDPDLDFLNPQPKPAPSSTSTECLAEPTATQNLAGLIKGFDEEMNWDNSNFSDGFNDAMLVAACDELESSFSEQNSEGSDAVGASNQEKESQKVDEACGMNFSILDSPEREPKPSPVPEKRKIGESQPKTSKSKKLKLPPWLMSQRIA